VTPNLTVALPQIAETRVLAFFLVLGRVGGLFAFAPVFSSPLLPLRIRGMIAAALALALTPLASHDVVIPTDVSTYLGLLLKEVGVGLVLAFPLALLTAGIQAGSAVIETIIGFSFGAVIDPMSNQPNGVIGQLLAMFAALILMLSGGDRIMLGGLAQSFATLPLTAYPSIAHIAAGTTLAPVFVIGLEITAPVLVAVIVADCALGLVSRAVPQMNVFVVGLPVKVLLCLVVLAGSLPFVQGALQGQLTQLVSQALTTISS
jgi:flagellar biosynthesis protein FliR